MPAWCGIERKDKQKMRLRYMKASETTEQIMLFAWAKMNEHIIPELRLLYHIPNEGKRTQSSGSILKAAGLRAGVPDICLPVARQGFNALYIEMKYGENKPTRKQKEYMSELSKYGASVAVCYSAEQAREVKGEITQKALPLSDFWERQIVGLLGFSQSAKKDILHNLREGRAGTTDTQRKVTFNAGKGTYCFAMVTFKIGRLNDEAAETFILTIREIQETAGLDRINDEPLHAEAVEGEVIEGGGIPLAPALRIVSKHTGFCKYCNQSLIIEAPDGLSGEDYNDYATKECDCDRAQMERARAAKFRAAAEWANGVFNETDAQLQTALSAIHSTFEGTVDHVTMKIGKYTHKIDRDGDGMIRIKTVYKDSNEETF